MSLRVYQSVEPRTPSFSPAFSGNVKIRDQSVLSGNDTEALVPSGGGGYRPRATVALGVLRNCYNDYKWVTKRMVKGVRASALAG